MEQLRKRLLEKEKRADDGSAPPLTHHTSFEACDGTTAGPEETLPVIVRKTERNTGNQVCLKTFSVHHYTYRSVCNVCVCVGSVGHSPAGPAGGCGAAAGAVRHHRSTAGGAGELRDAERESERKPVCCDSESHTNILSLLYGTETV